MNFLKVKKYLAVFFVSFFISIGFANAKELTGFIHTNNSTRLAYSNSINLFEESFNRTEFMNLLYSEGQNLGNYLNDFYSIGNSEFFTNQYKYGISILSVDDLKYFNAFGHYYKDGSNSKNYVINDYDTFVNHLFSNESSGYAKYHTVNYLEEYSFEDVSRLIFITTRTSVSSTSYGSFSVNSDYSSLSFFPKYVFLFNSSGVSIGYIEFEEENASQYWGNGYNGNFYTSLSFRFPFDDVSYPDMTSWYFYSFKLHVNSGIFDKIYPEFFWLDGYDNYVSVSTNAGYSGISGWFKSLSGSNYDVDSYNMRFVYEDVFYQSGSDSKSLFEYWLDDSSFIVPTNYLYLDISKSKKGYYLTPKSGCSYNDYILYYSGASSLSVYALYFNYYKYNSDNSNIEIYKRFGVFSSKAYVNYSYDPLKDLGVGVDTFYNYAINIYQYTTKYSYLLYYNPVCYTYDLASSSDIVLDFENGSYTLSSTEIQTNYNNDTINGSNYVSGGTSSSQGSSNGNVSNSTIIDGNNYDTSSINSVLENIPSYVSGIVDSVQALVGMTTVFLTGLPPMIYNFLFSVFAIGMIIFIIKLIK